MCANAFRGQQRASGPLALELQVIVSPLTWVLGADLQLSGVAGSILNH